jgi:hypothetical protein
MNAEFGFDMSVVGRVDWQEKQARFNTQSMETIWRPVRYYLSVCMSACIRKRAVVHSCIRLSTSLHERNELQTTPYDAQCHRCSRRGYSWASRGNFRSLWVSLSHVLASHICRGIQALTLSIAFVRAALRSHQLVPPPETFSRTFSTLFSSTVTHLDLTLKQTR